MPTTPMKVPIRNRRFLGTSLCAGAFGVSQDSARHTSAGSVRTGLCALWNCCGSLRRALLRLVGFHVGYCVARAVGVHVSTVSPLAINFDLTLWLAIGKLNFLVKLVGLAIIVCVVVRSPQIGLHMCYNITSDEGHVCVQPALCLVYAGYLGSWFTLLKVISRHSNLLRVVALSCKG